jgi:hypothetical protein
MYELRYSCSGCDSVPASRVDFGLLIFYYDIDIMFFLAVELKIK